MTVPGTDRFYEPMATTTMGSDEPVSAFKAWKIRENIQHVINSSTQYRVNWCAFKTSAAGIPTDTIKQKSTESANPRYWAAAFPVAVHNPTEPVALDIRIGALIEGSTTSVAVSANIVPHRFGKAVSGLPSHDMLWSGSGSTTSTTGAWVIDEQATIPADVESLYRSAIRIYSSYDDSTTRRPVKLPLFRLEIRASGTYTGTGSSHIVGVQVKEYAL